MNQLITGLITLSLSLSGNPSLPADFAVEKPIIRQVVDEKVLDLTIRPEGFGENILYALKRLEGEEYQKTEKPVSTRSSRGGYQKYQTEPFEVGFALLPGQVFAFHPNVLPEFAPPAGGSIVTFNSYFLTTEGYKSVFGLGGNGVCHLASLINWASIEAGLQVTSYVDHDFYSIPGIDKKWGVSIMSTDKRQNLYIKNNFDYLVIFYFVADTNSVTLKILK